MMSSLIIKLNQSECCIHHTDRKLMNLIAKLSWIHVENNIARYLSKYCNVNWLCHHWFYRGCCVPDNTACLSRTCAESLGLQHPDFRTVQVQQEGGGHDPCAGEPTSPHSVVHRVLVQFVCICSTGLIPRLSWSGPNSSTREPGNEANSPRTYLSWIMKAKSQSGLTLKCRVSPPLTWEYSKSEAAEHSNFWPHIGYVRFLLQFGPLWFWALQILQYTTPSWI